MEAYSEAPSVIARWRRIAFPVLALLAILLLASTLSSVLNPVLIAVLLAVLLNPVVNLAARVGLPRALTVGLLYIALALAVGLPPEQRLILVLFAAMPTASSAYVLAARMGGDGPFVAGLVSVSILLGMVSIPWWLAVLGWVT